MTPFRLLEINQDFLKIKPGETMEILFEEPQIPGDLFRILPEASYEIVSEETFAEKKASKIVLRKKSEEQSNTPIRRG
jgi:TusA-related sulfurtransferase